MSARFVLIDETAGATTANGEALDVRSLDAAARLMTVYLNRCVGAFWGIAGGALVRAASSPTDIQSGEWPAHIDRDLPVPDAIAYHTVNGVGQPDIYDGISLSGSLFGPGGWFTAMTHELAETVGDPGINTMRRDMKGRLFDQELGDPLEVQSFPMTILPDGTLADTPNTTAGWGADGSFTAYASNFVTDAYFTPNAAGPFDYMTAMGLAGADGPAAPFTVVPAGGGDYQMFETDPQDDTQVMGLRAASGPLGKKQFTGSLGWRAKKKAHPSSRTYRRGLRIAAG
jgi:hypothetical protein